MSPPCRENILHNFEDENRPIPKKLSFFALSFFEPTGPFKHLQQFHRQKNEKKLTHITVPRDIARLQ
jgi:hypothetical protein